MKYKNTAVILVCALLLTGCAGTAASQSSKITQNENENVSEEAQTSDGSQEPESLADEESQKTESSADENSQRQNASDDVPSASGDVFAMDTYMSITCYGDRCEEALAAAEAEISRLDDMLSVGNADSEIAKINSTGSGQVSDDTMEMIQCAMQVYETTGGAFDITIYPLMELWGFTSGNFAVPQQSAIDALLSEVGSDRLTVDTDTNTITLGENQGIDLGGIAKGFTSNRLMEIFEEYDLVSGLVSLGGNVQVYRTKPDGSMWKCGIVDPNDPDTSMMGVIRIDDEAVITSGAYERYFTDEETGETYHHIIDPSTGYSAENGLVSSTVVSKNGMLADALSTSCYIMGLDGSLDYWQEYGDDFELILMTDDDEIYITEGLKDRFTSDYPVTVVEKE